MESEAFFFLKILTGMTRRRRYLSFDVRCWTFDVGRSISVYVSPAAGIGDMAFAVFEGREAHESGECARKMTLVIEAHLSRYLCDTVVGLGEEWCRPH